MWLCLSVCGCPGKCAEAQFSAYLRKVCVIVGQQLHQLSLLSSLREQNVKGCPKFLETNRVKETQTEEGGHGREGRPLLAGCDPHRVQFIIFTRQPCLNFMMAVIPRITNACGSSSMFTKAYLWTLKWTCNNWPLGFCVAAEANCEHTADILNKLANSCLFARPAIMVRP